MCFACCVCRALPSLEGQGRQAPPGQAFVLVLRETETKKRDSDVSIFCPLWQRCLAASYKQKQARNRRQSTQHHATRCAKTSLWLNFMESLPNSAAVKTKKSAQSKRRNESYGRLKKGSRFLHWSQRKHGPDQSHKSLDFAVSKC